MGLHFTKDASIDTVYPPSRFMSCKTMTEASMCRVVTDNKGFLSSVFDFSQLKFKERDDLEFVFKFWLDESKRFDIDALW